jgi:hypothetical protein
MWRLEPSSFEMMLVTNEVREVQTQKMLQFQNTLSSDLLKKSNMEIQ